MYRLSRVWNRLAYLIMKLGRKLVWDYTGKNRDILTKDNVLSGWSEDLMCGK